MSNLEPRQNPGMKPGAREEKTVPASYKTYRFALLLSIFRGRTSTRLKWIDYLFYESVTKCLNKRKWVANYLGLYVFREFGKMLLISLLVMIDTDYKG